VSILEVADTADGSSRRLQCASCLSAWEYRRILCPSCGNEDERTLGYYESPTFPHVRVDTCEQCGRYIKTVDLRRLGLAVPLIDEVAAAPLDVWASERGYEKIELNLVGL
jgi:FdhE protein